MPSLKEYTVKIARLNSTRKLTRTMKMVSANKLRKSQELLKQAQAYETAVRSALRRVGVGDPAPPRGREARRILILLITSDRGLCAGFNNNLHRQLVQWIKEQAVRPDQVSLSFCGRRGFFFFRNRATVEKCYQINSAKPGFSEAQRIYLEVHRAFMAGRFDEVHLAYNQFRSSLAQAPVVERLLPMDWPAQDSPVAAGGARVLYSAPDILAGQLTQALGAGRLFAALVASAAGEHGARMTAMENSSANADELILEYRLRRNRLRQAAITRELSEITSGAEALQ